MKSSRLRKAIIGFITALVLIGLMVLYLVFFVEERREARIERNFRILNTISENIQQLSAKLPLNAANLISQREGLGSTRSVYKGDRVQGLREDANQLQNNLLNKQTAYKFKLPEEDQSGQDYVYCELSREGFEFKFAGFRYFKSYQDFFPPLFRSDAFDHYLVVGPYGNVLYHSRGMNLLQFDPRKMALEKADSSQAIAGSFYSRARISGKEYRVFTNPLLVFDQELQLIGLSSKDTFNRATIYISSFYLIIIALLFALLLLSYPFLKLYFISKNERLKIGDLFYAVMALFIGTALSSLLVLDVLQYRQYQTTTIPEGLEAISQSVKSKFRAELKQILVQLYDFDRIYDEMQVAAGGQTVPDIAMSEGQAIASSDTTAMFKPWLEQFAAAEYQNFLNVAWISKEGMQEVKWTRNSQNTRKIKVAEREYFQGVIDGSYWFHHQYPFVMESISSLNDGKFYASISIDTENPDLPVATMTTKLKSLHSPVLSLGYGFALIDPAGKVWFHSNPRKNLQENLLEELSDDRKLRSYLLSRSKGNFSISYHGDEYMMQVLPLDTWPLYLVTYYDKSYLNAANAEILSFSLISLAAFLLPSLLVVIFLLYNRSRKSKLQFREYHLDWLIPHPGQHWRYLRSTLYLVSLAILYFIFFRLIYESSPEANLSLLFMVYSLPVLGLGGSYLLLQSQLRRQDRPAAVYIFFGVLLLLILVWASISASALWVGSFILLALLLWWGVNRIPKSSWQKRASSRHFNIYYRAMAVAGLLCLSLPLIYSSFKIGHDTEFLLYNRLVQLDLAEKMDQALNTGLSDQPEIKKGHEMRLNQLPSVHLSPQMTVKLKVSEAGALPSLTPEPAELSSFMDIYSKIRPLYNEPVVQSLYLNEKSGLDGRWNWSQSDIPGIDFSFHSSFRPQSKLLVAVFSLHSKLPVYLLPWPGDKNFPLFLLLVFILLLILYRLVKFLYERIFIGETFDIQWLVNIEQLLFEDGKLAWNLKEQRLFYIGLPKSGKSAYLSSLISAHGVKLEIFDLASLYCDRPVDIQPSTELVIFDHFEYGLQVKAINDRKLRLLEETLRNQQAGIILVSSLHPFDFFQEMEKGATATDPEAGYDYFRWQRLLANFQKIYAQSSSLHYGMSEFSGLPEKEEMDLGELLTLECEALPYLKKLQPAILRSLLPLGSAKMIPRDELILKVQSIAAFYYHSLWLNCSFEEKYLLYDLAQDGLINTRNSRVINSLINKGLVVNHGLLKIANLSFRNYILSHIAAGEALAIEKSISKDSTWRQIRGPLIVVLLLLAAFLFYTQKDLLDNVVAMVTAIGGAVLTILRFSGNLGVSGNKTPAKKE